MKLRVGVAVLILALLVVPVALFAAGTKEAGAKGAPIATFKYWVPIAEFVATRSSNLGDIPMYKELEKRTNVHIVFSHPPAGQEQDQFNLMIASRDLPDIIEWSWISYPGGPEKAISDKIVIPLNDLIKKNAPNLTKLIGLDKERDKLFKTDNGTYYAYPFIKSPLENGFTLVWHGPQFRKEWLDELKLPVPTTMDEWESTLMAFKTKKNADAPLSFNWLNLPISNSFVSAYGVGIDYYQENGKIKFGPIEPGFKDFLTTFNRWYNEG
ncbi:MAG TPA: ABC transporter substrate-binding protein, partial [Spirochaetia bacterium]|nr:ABC transporter substrate-binding protein [Spirochaetia bacterium]